LPADQRKSRIEQEQQQQQALEAEQLRQMELELQQAAEREEAERKRQEELARQKPVETAVTIEGNRVFVPVTIGNLPISSILLRCKKGCPRWPAVSRFTPRSEKSVT
jgi:hypothetical protein